MSQIYTICSLNTYAWFRHMYCNYEFRLIALCTNSSRACCVSPHLCCDMYLLFDIKTNCKYESKTSTSRKLLTWWSSMFMLLSYTCHNVNEGRKATLGVETKVIIPIHVFEPSIRLVTLRMLLGRYYCSRQPQCQYLLSQETTTRPIPHRWAQEWHP